MASPPANDLSPREAPVPDDEPTQGRKRQALLSPTLPQVPNRPPRTARQRLQTIDAKLPGPTATDTDLLRKEIAFNGAMILGDDPLKIGLNNFADLQNLRYTNVGLEGTQGYSRINTVALASLQLRNGIQFVKPLNGTPASHLLVQANGIVYQHLTAPPAQGDFSATTLFADGAGAGLGRFALAPDGTVLYCNGVEAAIWGSAEHRVGAVINYDDPAAAFRYDITERMQNTLSDASNRFTLIPDAAGDIWLLIGSTRPLQGIRFYLQTVNTAVSTTTIEYWNGAAWVAVAAFADGTLVAGVTLARTGSMTFTSTVSTARVRIEDERLLYFYRVRVGATGTPDATVVLSQVTVNAPMQPIVDIWDGVERKPIHFETPPRDYTLEILEPSTQAQPIAADLGAGPSAFIGFEERMTALRIRMLLPVNGDPVTIDILYWNGTAYTSVGTITDTTILGGATFGQSGDIIWNAPVATSEFRQVRAGKLGYWYFISASGPFSVSVLVDTITGIPAQRFDPQTISPGYRFPFLYQNRVLLANRAQGNEGHRIDYSATGAPDVWNGEDSSDQGKSIFVGGPDDLVAGIEFFDRFSTIANRVVQSLAILLKAKETWVLRGSAPDTFQLFPISSTIGSPCPLTLALADLGGDATQDIPRTVALWVSAQGPMMFDGGAVHPMRFRQPDGMISSIEPYFDPNDSRYVTTGSLLNARGWFDTQWGEYNLLLPTAGSTTCNAWLCCDMRRKKWFRKVPTVYPQMGFAVVDSTGGQYVYGGIDTGFLLRLENGNTWNGTGIAHVVQTSDMLLSGSMWDTTLMRYLKAGVVRETGVSATLSLAHAADGSGVFTQRATLDLVGGTARWRKVTQALNLRGWSHQLQLSVTTTDKAKAPQLIGLGLLYRIERFDL